jgi:hypothetical protein
MANEVKVKVKILKHVGTYAPEQIVDVSEAEAEQLCAVSYTMYDKQKIENRRAIKMAELEELQKAPLDMEKLSQGELAAYGLKNIVETPKDEAFDHRVEQLKKSSRPSFEEKKDDAELESAKSKNSKRRESA